MHRTIGLSFLFALISIAGLGAQAQPTINPKPSLDEFETRESVNDILVGKARGRLNMRYNPRKSGAVTGGIFGNRIEGYRTLGTATQAESLAFVQFKFHGGVEVATNVYVAEYNTTERSWIGASYAIHVAAGGASSARNATPFRTSGPLSFVCANTPACVDRNSQLTPLPTATTPIAIDAAAGFGIDANGHRGPLVLRAGAGGDNEGVLGGHVLGDALSGHYARGAGTIAFLRRQGGRPIQVFVGVLDAGPGGIKGGRGYPLSASGGTAPFAWSVVTNDQIVSGLRSLDGRCLTPADPTSGPGGILTTTTICTNNVNVSWVVFAVGANGGNTLFSVVSVATGLCLHMPGTAGAAVTQQVCNGARRQSLLIDELQTTGVLPDGSPTYTAVAINTAAAFGMTGNGLNLHAPGPNGSECLAKVATGEAVEFSCFENHKKFKAVVSNTKAVWTHNP